MNVNGTKAVYLVTQWIYILVQALSHHEIPTNSRQVDSQPIDHMLNSTAVRRDITTVTTNYGSKAQTFTLLLISTAD